MTVFYLYHNLKEDDERIKAKDTLWYVSVKKSRMKGDFHVRFCERLGVKFPLPTRRVPRNKVKRLRFTLYAIFQDDRL